MIRTLRRVSESLVLGSLLSFLATSCGQEAPEQGLPANARRLPSRRFRIR